MSDLGSFLDKTPSRKKGSSATVGGNTPEGEIYIRADGKKVRRVKKSVPRSEGSVGGGEKARGVKKTTSSGSLAGADSGSKGGLNSFLGDSGPTPKKKSGAVSVGGDRNVSSADGEIYIRPDGKKVRRVKKAGRSASGGLDQLAASASDLSASGDGPRERAPPSPTKSSSKPKKDLGAFLNRESGDNGRRKGVRSVSGMSASGLSTASKSKDGDVYINKDGKKVRRVRKSSASVGGDIRRSKSGDSSVDGGASVDSRNVARQLSSSKLAPDRQHSSSKLAPDRQHSSSKLAPDRQHSSSKLDRQHSASKLSPDKQLTKTPSQSRLEGSRSGLSKSPSSSGLTRSNSSSKLDRGDKPLSRTPSASKLNPNESPQKNQGLGGFLEKGDGKGDKGAKVSKRGSASVAGSTPTKGGDVYIRADGKKVRRVRRTPSSSSTAGDSSKENAGAPAPSGEPKSSLSNFLGKDGGSNLPKKSGSKSVGASKSVGGSGGSVEGEIYIRPDGKKVRRVRRTTSSKSADGGASSASVGGSGGGGPALGSFLGTKTAEGAKNSGAATVTGAPTASSDKKAEEGEIYINKDGKKVRRVRRPKSTASPAGDLAGFLDKPGTSSGNAAEKSVGGGVSVSGANPATDGEIYIRPDGKKVRRIRRSQSGRMSSGTAAAGKPAAGTASNTSTTTAKKGGQSDGGRTLSALLDNQPRKTAAAPSADGDESIHEAATVAGDKVISSSEEGEIVIRADGKKVRRVRKTKSSSAPAATQQDGEVYRRADGKLVRRVRKGGAASVAPPAPTPAKPITPITADVTGGDSKPKGPVSRLSPDDEKIADTYRKMLGMGLPDDAVKHKMNQDGISQTIIASVLNREVPAAPKANGAASAGSGGLTGEEEAIAGRFRKMLKMGLPEDAVYHKMVAEGVDRKVITAVVGNIAPQPQSSAGAAPASTAAAPAGPSLSAEEEATAGRFRKMLKMGLPDDAVKHKMVAEGVDDKVISAVLGGGGGSAAAAAPPAPPPAPQPSAGALSPEEDSIAARFRKMLGMGLPDDAVRHKMVAEGVDDKIIAAVLQPPAAAPAPPPAPAPAPPPAPAAPMIVLSAEDEEVAARFRKMLKMGLPPDAVQQKMAVEAVDERIMKAVLQGGEAPAPAPPAPTPATAPPPAPAAPVSALSAADEETAARFRKMLAMGLPDDAVKHKMVQEGVGADIIAAVLFKSPPAASPATSGAPPAAAAAVVSSAAAPQALPSGAQTVPAPPGHPGGAAYVVVVSDGQPAPPIATAADIKANPDDKFTVSVGDGQGGKGTKKLMSLDEIAAATGQSKDELEKMVKEKQEKGEPLNFLLNHEGGGGEGSADGMFEVQVAGGGAPRGPLPPGDPSKMKEVGEGKEVVDTKLADAARAVGALGDMDMKALLSKLQAGDMEVLLSKLNEAEKRQKKLEKQLAQAGVAIAEDIDYSEAKVKVEEIAKRMGEIGGSDVTVADKDEQTRLREEYFKLEQEMERYNTALMLTEEYQAEQDRIEQKWEDDNAPGNLEALQKIRRHMPVKIRHMSEAELTNTPSPNGKFLPKATAKKFKRTNVLQCIRLNPDDLERMHPSTLENMRVTGLTLTERRALYCHLKCLGPKWEKNKAEKMTERKWTWYQMMKSNFKENLAPYLRHVEQYGPPENHQGCPLLGKQCPIKADKIIDYDGDYGWTPEAEYEVSDVKKSDADDPGAKAMQEALELAREKKANERADILKKHYKGKLLQVSKANGSCESMDEAMDRMENHMMKWIEFKIEKGEGIVEADKKKEVANFTEAINELKLSTLDFAQRSGMQMSGKKKAGGDGEDIRSTVEGGLADEVWECANEFFAFIKKRMTETDMKDTRIEKTIELLDNMLSELHVKNGELFTKLGTQRPERSRKLKKTDELTKEVEEKMKPKEEEAPAEEAGGGGGGPPGPPRGGGGRGGLLDAIQGGRGRGRGGGGRGGLLDAISGARGRGRGRGGGGGRGGLLDAIAGARGGGGDGGGGDDGGGGGRGGLLASIQGRGRGGGGGGGDGGGGRGGLLAAIAARGGG